MNRKHSIRHQYRLFMGLTALTVILLAGYVLFYEMRRIVSDVSANYAQLLSNEVAVELQAYLGREIALSEKAAADERIRAWMRNPDNPTLKREAYQELRQYGQFLRDKNLFIVPEATREIHFIDSTTDFDAFNPYGKQDPKNENDVWYFKTLEADAPFLLNVDVDRYLDTMRVWINVPVREGGEPLGMIGTGLYLGPFNEQFFSKHAQQGIETFIINRYGSVQLDKDVARISQNSFDTDADSVKTVYRLDPSADFATKVRAYLQNSDTPLLLKLENGPYQFVAIAPIAGTSWHSVTAFSTQALYRFGNLLPIGVITVITLVLMAFLSEAVVRRTFVEPFEKLNDSLVLDEETQTIDIYGLDRNDEFGTLADSIHRLTDYLVRSVPAGVFLMSQKGRFLYGNPYFLNQFKCNEIREYETLLADGGAGPFRHKQDQHRFLNLIAAGQENITYEAEMRDRDGGTFWAEIRCNRLTSASGSRYEGVLLNIQDVKTYEESLLTLATTDRLTSAFNRHHLDRVTADEIERSDRYGGLLALIILDLDHFKRINDQWGHDTGDEVLIRTVQEVQTLLRGSDILARWGGEEFAILMPGASLFGAQSLAERARKLLEQVDHPLAGTVTASFGIAQRNPGESYEDWFRRADRALYLAKEQGRNRVVADTEGSQDQPAFVKLIWQDAFECGVPTIDAQHRKLFELANGFIESQADQNGLDLALRQYRILREGVREHFEYESALLEQSLYPEEEQTRHNKEHQRLLAHIDELEARLENGDLAVPDVALTLVQEIILDHMVREDTKFFPYLEPANSEDD